MTPEQAVRGCAGPVGRLGGAFMFDAQTAAAGAALGLQGWSWYHLGRGGVLGDGPADAAIAAFGFFPPVLQRKAWDKGRAVLAPTQAAGHYADACAAFGERVFAAAEAPGRTAELLTAVTDAAPVMGSPVFAGWRGLVAARSGDSEAARLALALQVAREHRGGAHLVAVAAQGVDPLQAVVSGRYGPDNAKFFGWPQPWPAPEAASTQMAAAEALTDALVRPAFAALAEPELEELTNAVRALKAG